MWRIRPVSKLHSLVPSILTFTLLFFFGMHASKSSPSLLFIFFLGDGFVRL